MVGTSVGKDVGVVGLRAHGEAVHDLGEQPVDAPTQIARTQGQPDAVDADHRASSRNKAASSPVWASGQWPMQLDAGGARVQLDMQRLGCLCRGVGQQTGGHEAVGLGAAPWWRHQPVKPRVRAPTGQHALGHTIGLRPILGLVARGPVRAHHAQAPLYPLSIHVHRVFLAD